MIRCEDAIGRRWTEFALNKMALWGGGTLALCCKVDGTSLTPVFPPEHLLCALS